MTLLVKICGLSQVEDVDAAIDAGADALGFVFAKSVREVTPQQAARLTASVPSSVKRVAVMLHPSNEDWQQVLKTFSPDVLQSDADDFSMLDVPTSIERWPVYREGGIKPSADIPYVFEGPKSGQGETVDWSQAARLAVRGNMILAGGLGATNVAEAIATVRPYGVDVSSAVESAPGRKDSNLIRAFISAARAAEKNL